MFKREVNHIVDLCTLKLANNSKWVSPSFAQTNPKRRRVSLLRIFKILNRKVKYKTHPMLKIQAMVTKFKSF